MDKPYTTGKKASVLGCYSQFYHDHVHRFCTCADTKRSKLTAGLTVRQGTGSKTPPKPRTPQPQKRRRRRKAAEQLFPTAPPGGHDPTALSRSSCQREAKNPPSPARSSNVHPPSRDWNKSLSNTGRLPKPALFDCYQKAGGPTVSTQPWFHLPTPASWNGWTISRRTKVIQVLCTSTFNPSSCFCYFFSPSPAYSLFQSWLSILGQRRLRKRYRTSPQGGSVVLFLFFLTEWRFELRVMLFVIGSIEFGVEPFFFKFWNYTNLQCSNQFVLLFWGFFPQRMIGVWFYFRHIDVSTFFYPGYPRAVHCHLAHPKLCVCQRMYRRKWLKKKIDLQHCFIRVYKAVFFGLLLFMCVYWLFQLLISPHNFFKSSRWKSGTILLLILSFFSNKMWNLCWCDYFQIPTLTRIVVRRLVSLSPDDFVFVQIKLTENENSSSGWSHSLMMIFNENVSL